MSLIGDALLANLRTIAASALVETGQIRRATRVSDGQGGFNDTAATASTPACRVVAASGSPEELVIADRLAGRTAFMVYLPYDADVRESDRIAVGATTYEILGVLAPTTWQVHTRAVCAREG